MGDVPPPWGWGGDASRLPAREHHKMPIFQAQPKAETPLLFLTRTPQWRVPARGFPNPHPFLAPPPPLAQHPWRCQEDAARPLPRKERDVGAPAPSSVPSNSQPVPQPNCSLHPRGARGVPNAFDPRSSARPRGQDREARRRPGIIEPGSFIYTVKVTSNFLRLSCSSAIKSWRGYEWAASSPTRGEGSPSAGTRASRCACAITSETWLLQVIASEGFFFFF